MVITRNDVEIELTPQEIQQAYDIYLQNCKVLDAKSQYEDWVEYEGFEKTLKKDVEEFTHMYGFHPDAAADPGSAYYLLARFVAKFDEKFDCNRAENDIWQEAIGDVMAEMAESAAKASGDKVYEVTFQETHERKARIVAASADAAKEVWEKDYFDLQAPMTFTSGPRIIGAVAISAEEVQ